MRSLVLFWQSIIFAEIYGITQLNQLDKSNTKLYRFSGRQNADNKTQSYYSSDLENFYQLCGGIQLFTDATFSTLIVPPHKLLQANLIIFADVDVKHLQEIKDDISWSWYLIGMGPNSQFITIDLSPKRLGNVYNSFWINHPRDSFIIAKSFTDLLLSLIEAKGEYYPWDMAGFVSLGNPYQ